MDPNRDVEWFLAFVPPSSSSSPAAGHHPHGTGIVDWPLHLSRNLEMIPAMGSPWAGEIMMARN